MYQKWRPRANCCGTVLSREYQECLSRKFVPENGIWKWNRTLTPRRRNEIPYRGENGRGRCMLWVECISRCEAGSWACASSEDSHIWETPFLLPRIGKSSMDGNHPNSKGPVFAMCPVEFHLKVDHSEQYCLWSLYLGLKAHPGNSFRDKKPSGHIDESPTLPEATPILLIRDWIFVSPHIPMLKS